MNTADSLGFYDRSYNELKQHTNNDGFPLRGGITENTVNFEHDLSGRCKTAFSLTLLKLIPEDKFS